MKEGTEAAGFLGIWYIKRCTRTTPPALRFLPLPVLAFLRPMALLLPGLLFPLVVQVGAASASFPVFPSLLPPSTTLVGPAEEEEVRPGGGAFFLQQNNTEVRAQVGSTVILHCPAHNIGENMISWIRRRDYHLLTVGYTTYTSDQRFQVRYIRQEKDWQLHILYIQARDDGLYECQVSSHPPVSLMSTLHVHEATSEVLGGPEKYVRVGSSLRLVCVLRDNTQPPAYVFWYHGPHMINYHATREVRVENSGALSVLFLTHVAPSDSGNYTCAPSNTRPAHILIHVLKGGETPAAIHSGGKSKTPGLFLFFLLLLALVTHSNVAFASTPLSQWREACPAPRKEAPGGAGAEVRTLSARWGLMRVPSSSSSSSTPS